MSAPERADGWTWLARIRRPQGRKGEVFAEILTDFPEKFAERRRLWLLSAPVPDAPNAAATTRAGARTSKLRAAPAAPREVALARHWLHKSGVVLHFEGVDSISAAEQLSGMVVVIPRELRAPLSEDEAYIGDLIGCTLIDVAGVGGANVGKIGVGKIVDVDLTAGPAPLLVVESGKGEVLVPFAKSYLRRIDIENQCVEMALPAGLVELNEETGNDGTGNKEPAD